jgi:pimeloyl-ACP methyl ester carboxylesterase
MQDPLIDNYNYSYVLEAVDEYGYYDRLGIGMSSHGNPLTEIQALLEVDALRALTEGLRDGSIEGLSSFDKVLHVGHSFGSQHTYALTAMYPNISDGIALTGFSQNGSFAGLFLLGGNFIEANQLPALSSYPDGYFASGDATAVQINFFAPGDFDPALLDYATNVLGEPVTVGELLSFGGETGSVNNFAGPVHIITGERDIPYCGGNCLAAPTGYPNIPSTSKANFPNAENFEVTIIPGAGHGLNLQYTHPQTYASILNYFVQNGLAGNGTSSSSGGSGSGGGGWAKKGGKGKGNKWYHGGPPA